VPTTRDRRDAVRVLIVGAGAAGRRSLRTLAALGVDAKVLPNAGAWPAAAAWRPAGVIVGTPTARHIDTALRVCPAGGHLLIGPPAEPALDELVALRAGARDRCLTVMSGARLRSHPTLAVVRRWIADGRVGAPMSAQARWNGPRPTRTLMESIDALRWLLGEVETSAAMPEVVMLAFASGALGTTTRDPLLPPACHVLNVVGDAGTIHWDLTDGVARLWRPCDQVWMRVAPGAFVDHDALRVAEMRHFLDCVRGAAQPRGTFDDGIRAAELARAALRPDAPDRRAP
jgi:predicted dehydrogenase